MKLKYKNEVIFESNSIDALEIYKESFCASKEKVEQRKLLEKMNCFLLEMKSLPEENFEGIKDYENKIRTKYPRIVKELEELGEKYYKKKVDVFFTDVSRNLYGYIINDKKVTLKSLITLETKNNISKDDFTIEK